MKKLGVDASKGCNSSTNRVGEHSSEVGKPMERVEAPPLTPALLQSSLFLGHWKKVQPSSEGMSSYFK